MVYIRETGWWFPPLNKYERVRLILPDRAENEHNMKPPTTKVCRKAACLRILESNQQGSWWSKSPNSPSCSFKSHRIDVKLLPSSKLT